MTLRHARRMAGEIASRNVRTAAGSCPSAARARESREARSAAGAVSTPPFARTIEQQWGAGRAGVNEVTGIVAALRPGFSRRTTAIDPKWLAPAPDPDVGVFVDAVEPPTAQER